MACHITFPPSSPLLPSSSPLPPPSSLLPPTSSLPPPPSHLPLLPPSHPPSPLHPPSHPSLLPPPPTSLQATCWSQTQKRGPISGRSLRWLSDSVRQETQSKMCSTLLLHLPPFLLLPAPPVTRPHLLSRVPRHPSPKKLHLWQGNEPQLILSLFSSFPPSPSVHVHVCIHRPSFGKFVQEGKTIKLNILGGKLVYTYHNYNYNNICSCNYDITTNLGGVKEWLEGANAPPPPPPPPPK